MSHRSAVLDGQRRDKHNLGQVCFLDSIFTPIVQDLPTYVKDSSHALRIFKEFTFTGPNKYLFTMDVKSLYTCIPHNDGLQPLKFFLDKRPHQSPPTTTLLRLAELVLTTNAFSFNSQYYLQKSGVAMGSKLGQVMLVSSLAIKNS